MSVSRTDYVMLGIKYNNSEQFWKSVKQHDFMDKDEFFDDCYDDRFEGITIVEDGMNGEYVVVGKVLAQGEDGEGIQMTPCLKMRSDEYVLQKALDKAFGISGNIQIWAFTHWH